MVSVMGARLWLICQPSTTPIGCEAQPWRRQAAGYETRLKFPKLLSCKQSVLAQGAHVTVVTGLSRHFPGYLSLITVVLGLIIIITNRFV